MISSTFMEDDWEEDTKGSCWGDPPAGTKPSVANTGSFGGQQTSSNGGGGFNSQGSGNGGSFGGSKNFGNSGSGGFGNSGSGGFGNSGSGGFGNSGNGNRGSDGDRFGRGGGCRGGRGGDFGGNRDNNRGGGFGGDSERSGGGFRGGRGGGRGGGGFGSNRDSESGGFGSNQGFGGRGNSFGDSESGGFGGGGFRGGRGGGRGGFGGNRDESGTGGFGSNQGFGGRGNGFGDSESGGGFGNGGGFENRRGGRGGNRGGRDFSGSGFGSEGGRFGNDSQGGGSFQSSGFGGNGGGGRFDGEESGGNRGGRGGGRFDGEGGEDGEQPPRPPPYIPPEDTDDFTIYSAGINFDKYDKIKVEVTGNEPPLPVQMFEACGLSPGLLANVAKAGYNKPTPVQKYAIPIIKANRDLMACAQTGSGKTAAFLLPIMHHLVNEPAGICGDTVQPYCIIVSPTRELAMQIHSEARKFADRLTIKVGLVYGGTASNHQMGKLSAGCHLLVVTPGRMHDLVNKGRISFDKIRFVVLDEADRMLDMGFQGDIEKMMNHPSMPKTGAKNTVMFSATFPSDIQMLASKYMNNYLYVVVGMVGGACADVSQEFLKLAKFEKRPKLVEILQNKKPEEKAIVFVQTKRTADVIAAYLSGTDNNLSSTSIHGDRFQEQRETALREFRQGIRNILVATNVAARGLDIQGVHLVINFDLPKEVDEYVHRIGRTGRVGHTGRAISFYDDAYDKDLVPGLLKVLVNAEQNVPDWMQESGYGSNMDFSVSGGGAADIRDFSSAPAAPVADEEW